MDTGRAIPLLIFASTALGLAPAAAIGLWTKAACRVGRGPQPDT
jgi:hypothetical protein